MPIPMRTVSSSSGRQVGQTPTCTYAMKKMWQSQWLVLAASFWLQACAGVGYAFGSYSQLVKSELGYSQQQITILGIAKDLGASIGLIAGSLGEVVPVWCLVAIGGLHNLIGYGWLWLIVTNRVSVLPIWAVCILIFIGTNAETYFNTATLVTNVRNFPKSRGHVVGLLKGFAGLCSAIFTQIYATFYSPNQGAYLGIVALGPTLVSFLVMFIIRPIKTKTRTAEMRAESMGFAFIYADCGVLAAYLIVALVIQDLVSVSYEVSLLLTIVLLAMVALPLATPIVTWALSRQQETKTSDDVQEAVSTPTAADDDGKGVETPLLIRSEEPELGHEPLHEEGHALRLDDIGFTSGDLGHYVFESGSREGSFCGSVGMSELEDEKPADIDLLTESERESTLTKIRKQILRAAAEGAVRIKKKGGPHRGEDFTLGQALVKADFWLLFVVLLCGAGTGMAAIDNMGQISESQGYANSSVFVSMTSIFNFVGRLLGGYFSEILARNYRLPRSWALAGAQGLMGAGHFVIAMGWSQTLYLGTVLVGTGYGAHWGIIPPIISELFGLKKFGILYNFYTMATPSGVLFFSGFLAGYLYDVEAAKQNTAGSLLASKSHPHTPSIRTMVTTSTSTSCYGAVCFRSTFFVMMGVCVFAAFLNAILSIRTRRVYKTLYASASDSES